jgi:nitrogen-specific signal transduction histidine kinase
MSYLNLQQEELVQYNKNTLNLKLNKEKIELFDYIWNNSSEKYLLAQIIYDEEGIAEDFVVLDINPSFEQHKGLKRNNVIGKSVKEIYPNYNIKYINMCGEIFRTGKTLNIIEYNKNLDSWYDVQFIPLNSDNKFAIISVNITDVINLELHKDRNKLSFTPVNNCFNCFEDYIKKQDEIYITVSHELKTPLNVIYSANQAMENYLNNNIEYSKERLCNYNKSIKQNCYRLTKIINNIIDLSKMNNGLVKLNLNNVNIVEIVENLIQYVYDYAKSKQLRIIFDTDIEEKIIACDSVMIERVMLNLISNSIKYTNIKGKIYINIYDRGDNIEIVVRDNGRGIEKEQLGCLFDRYFQSDKSLTRNAEGNGIGLSLVKSIIELHGGKIKVKSKFGQGFTFKFILPVKTVDNTKLNSKYADIIERINIEFSDI